jgi:hypothetical protein
VALRDPIPDVPARAPGSVRRTMHVDVGPRGEWSSPLAMEGAARDLRTDSPGSPDTATVLAEVHVTAGFDVSRRLESLSTSPSAPWTAALIGARAGGGFRRHLEEVVPSAEASSLLRQVLDDMPAAALISGYGLMRMARRSGHHPGTLMPSGALDRMTDLCSGWRSGGTAVLSTAAGNGVPMQDCPPAPPLSGADSHAWHDIGALELDWMRRRRCIDVEVGPDGAFAIWAMFRDTVGEGGGDEVVLHEYAVRVGGVDGVVGWVEAEPRVLPFPECPAAADAVGALVGSEVRFLASVVPDTLTGIASCTHLNDLLRALGGVGDLLAPEHES